MNEISVLIASCDHFQDVWEPCLECVRRYWPDRPWPLYTMSNAVPWGEAPVLVGPDQGWTANLRVALDKANSEFVVLWLEDMLLCEPVNTFDCLAALDAMHDNTNVGAILLGPGPQTFEPIRKTFFGRIFRSSLYRISTAPTLWRTEFLKKILDSGTTAADFELKGTQRAATMPDEVWVVAKEPRPFRLCFTAVTRGEAEYGAIDWLRRVGIEWIPNRPIKGQQKGQKWPTVKAQ